MALQSNGIVAGTSFSNAVSVAAGDYHKLALLADGSVVAWGQNTYGQTNVPMEATNVIAIAAGSYHNLAIVGPIVSAPLSIPYQVANGLAIKLPTLRGRRYLVDRKHDLRESNWQVWQRIVGDGITRQLLVQSTDSDRAFFRARQIP